jgi:hypothetical protein
VSLSYRPLSEFLDGPGVAADRDYIAARITE